jgi:hypothetical protein
MLPHNSAVWWYGTDTVSGRLLLVRCLLRPKLQLVLVCIHVLVFQICRLPPEG